MAGTPTVYVICDKNCKFEGMTKEQIYTAIMQAVNEGAIKNIDAGFITTVKTINGLPLRFFVGEQAAYDALTDEEKENLFAIITNDTTKAGITEAIKKLEKDFDVFVELITSGLLPAGNAVNAQYLTNTEIHFDTVSTSGVKVAKITRGKTYIITAILEDLGVSNVAENLVISIPTNTAIDAIHSAPTRGGFYARCVMNSTPDLFFENSSGTKVTAKNVTIRMI